MSQVFDSLPVVSNHLVYQHFEGWATPRVVYEGCGEVGISDVWELLGVLGEVLDLLAQLQARRQDHRLRVAEALRGDNELLSKLRVV